MWTLHQDCWYRFCVTWRDFQTRHWWMKLLVAHLADSNSHQKNLSISFVPKQDGLNIGVEIPRLKGVGRKVASAVRLLLSNRHRKQFHDVFFLLPLLKVLHLGMSFLQLPGDPGPAEESISKFNFLNFLLVILIMLVQFPRINSYYRLRKWNKYSWSLRSYRPIHRVNY